MRLSIVLGFRIGEGRIRKDRVCVKETSKNKLRRVRDEGEARAVGSGVNGEVFGRRCEHVVAVDLLLSLETEGVSAAKNRR